MWPWLCHVMMVRARPKVVLSISTCALSDYLFQVKNIYFSKVKKNIQLLEMFDLYILTTTSFLDRIYWWVFNNCYVVVSCRNKYGEKYFLIFVRLQSFSPRNIHFDSFCSENSYHCKKTRKTEVRTLFHNFFTANILFWEDLGFVCFRPKNQSFL